MDMFGGCLAGGAACSVGLRGRYFPVYTFTRPETITTFHVPEKITTFTRPETITTFHVPEKITTFTRPETITTFHAPER
jgi:hypothetical protein